MTEAGFDSTRAPGAPSPRATLDLVGHEAAEAAMLDALRSGRLPHAWLLGGPRGIGKATLAWRLARFLLAHPDLDDTVVRRAASLAVDPAHPVVARLRSGAQSDAVLLRREWNEKTKKAFSEIRADDVRAAAQLFQRAPGAGGYRVCVLDSADDLNRHSANALLKLIEEPPRRSVFLVVAHRPGLVLPTIRSRCRMLLLRPLADEAVGRVLRALPRQQPPPDAEDVDAAVARAGGSVGRALELLDPARLALDRALHAELDRLPAVDWLAVHRLVDRLGTADGGEAADLAVETVLDWLASRVRADATRPGAARRLAPLAEVCDKVRSTAREASAYNLDRRPLFLSVFAELAEAVRSAGPA